MRLVVNVSRSSTTSPSSSLNQLHWVLKWVFGEDEQKDKLVLKLPKFPDECKVVNKPLYRGIVLPYEDMLTFQQTNKLPKEGGIRTVTSWSHRKEVAESFTGYNFGVILSCRPTSDEVIISIPAFAKLITKNDWEDPSTKRILKSIGWGELQPKDLLEEQEVLLKLASTKPKLNSILVDGKKVTLSDFKSKELTRPPENPLKPPYLR
jgi:hypothetical protein